MSEESELREKAIKRGEVDFLFFCKYFLPKYFNCEMASFHKELAKLPLSDLKDVVIAAPRYHGKSTFFSVALPIWCVCYKKFSPVLLISATLGLAETWVKNIKAEFEANEIILEHFGDMRGEPWAVNELWFKNGFRLRASGRGQQVRGWHYGLVIADDLEDDDLVRSETQMNQFQDWFNRALYNTLDDKAKLFYIGTMLAPNCFLKQLMEKRGWNRFYYQAYVDGIEDEAHVLFPGKWSHEGLQVKKQNDPYSFAMEFMNNPVPEEDKRFKPEWFQFYENLPGGLRVFMTIDPSLSMRKRADKTAMITCGVDSAGQIFVIDVYNALNNPDVLVEEVFRLNRTFNPFKIGIEVVVFQRMLQKYLEDKAIQKNIYLPIEALKTDTRTTKQMRIMSLIPYFSDMKVFMRKDQYNLIQQLKEFSPNNLNMKDDMIDAFAYQVQMWTKPGYSGAQTMLTGEALQKALQKRYMQNLFKDEDTIPMTRGYRSNFICGK